MAKKTTINVNGVLTEVTEFDHSAQEIDDGIARSKWQSNPNLLDNWYFVGGGAPGAFPVNQRDGWVVPPGTEYYRDKELTTLAQDSPMEQWHNITKVDNVGTFDVVGTPVYVDWADAVRGYVGVGYTVDRWKMSATNGQYAALLEDDGISIVLTPTAGETMQFNFYQKIAASHVPAGDYTLSFLYSSDHIVRIFAYQDRVIPGFADFPASQRQTLAQIPVSLTDATAGDLILYTQVNTTVAVRLKLYAAKLELGSEQTLAHQENGEWVLNEIPNYAEQLARCQRYQRAYEQAPTGYTLIGTGYAISTSAAHIALPQPTALRIAPSVVCPNLGALWLRRTTTSISGSSIKSLGVDAASAGAEVWMYVTLTDPLFTLGETVELYARQLSLFLLDANL